MIRKVFLASLLGVLWLSVAFGANVSAQDEPDRSDLTIGYIYLILENPYYQAHARHVQAYAEELGFELIEYDGQFDAVVQGNAMDDLIAQGVDGIVFALADANASVPFIQDALDAGIPVVTFAIKHGEGVTVPFVGIPEKVTTFEAGVQAAERFLENFEGQTAYVATVECPAVQQVVDRADGFLEGFTSVIEDAEIVARADGQCTREPALAASEDLLQSHPEVNVIYGGNADSALGALAALQGVGRGTVEDAIVVSHDGSEPEMIELVSPESALKLVVANTPRELARGTLDTLFDVIDGEIEMDSDVEVRIPAVVLNNSDVEALNTFLAEQYFSDIDLTEYAE